METDNRTINPNRIYTLDEVAKLFMLHHPRYLKPYLDSGSITAARVGKRLFITGQSILAFVNTHSMADSSEQQPTDSQPAGVQQQAQPEPEQEPQQPTDSQPAGVQQKAQQVSDDERYAAALALADAGLSNSAIAAKLTVDGVPTARGGAWTADAARRTVLTARKCVIAGKIEKPG